MELQPSNPFNHSYQAPSPSDQNIKSPEGTETPMRLARSAARHQRRDRRIQRTRLCKNFAWGGSCNPGCSRGVHDYLHLRPIYIDVAARNLQFLLCSVRNCNPLDCQGLHPGDVLTLHSDGNKWDQNKPLKRRFTEYWRTSPGLVTESSQYIHTAKAKCLRKIVLKSPATPMVESKSMLDNSTVSHVWNRQFPQQIRYEDLRGREASIDLNQQNSASVPAYPTTAPVPTDGVEAGESKGNDEIDEIAEDFAELQLAIASELEQWKTRPPSPVQPPGSGENTEFKRNAEINEVTSAITTRVQWPPSIWRA
jgi:hypothetical protein